MVLELWQTILEPDIDPLLARALRENPNFAAWWIAQALPGVESAEILLAEPNRTRERESWESQSRAGRETDLHVLVADRTGRKFAILTESKIVAPASENQPEDYSAYVRWGQETQRWTRGITMLMAPRGYVERVRSAQAYDISISYEDVESCARTHELEALANHLRAGIERYERVGEMCRNPDDAVSAFRVQYMDLLREEHPDLYACLSGTDARLFHSSQTWFYFRPRDLGRSGASPDEIIHKISNRTKEQQVEEAQYVSLHVAGMQNRLVELPNLPRAKNWRSSKRYAILDSSLESDAMMLFRRFEAEPARRVWRLIQELRNGSRAWLAALER